MFSYICTDTQTLAPPNNFNGPTISYTNKSVLSHIKSICSHIASCCRHHAPRRIMSGIYTPPHNNTFTANLYLSHRHLLSLNVVCVPEHTTNLYILYSKLLICPWGGNSVPHTKHSLCSHYTNLEVFAFQAHSPSRLFHVSLCL